ncbi:MAG: ABC transporter ATP-binding protein [Planctomycetes bacterium]|nr:ABC transporter ATP-binding protein [Planctomycetota bacterium]
MYEIQCSELSKRYGRFQALNKLNLTINQGEIFGFLGPNGAGKTTTIRLLMGMLIPTHGSASIHGLDCHKQRVELKRYIGYLPDDPAFYDYLKGIEILGFVGKLHGLTKHELHTKTEELLTQLELKEAAFDFAMNYSAGMKRKLALACAQIHNPDVYILDEPTSMLDPIATKDVQNWIKSQSAMGKTIFMSTHLLSQAEKICHRVGIIHKGYLLAVGTLEELKNKLCPGGSLEDIFFAVTSANTPQNEY